MERKVKQEDRKNGFERLSSEQCSYDFTVAEAACNGPAQDWGCQQSISGWRWVHKAYSLNYWLLKGKEQPLSSLVNPPKDLPDFNR